MALRNILMAVLVFLLAVVQTTILRGIEIMGVIPNLILVTVICYSLLREPRPGLVFGILCGLVLDWLGGRAVGVNTLLCMYIAYLCGLTGDRLFNNNIFVAVLFVVVMSLLYEAVFYIFNYLIWGNTDVLFALFGKVIPASVYNGLFTFLVYPVVHKLSGAGSNAI